MRGTKPDENTGAEQLRALLTPGEAAAVLKVPLRMVRRLTEERKLACTRVGRYIRYSEQQVAEYIKEREVPAARRRGQ